VDAGLQPWLMEVNATPSMKVAHEEAATQALIAQQKWDFVHDTFQLLRIQQHMFDEVSCSGKAWHGCTALLRLKLCEAQVACETPMLKHGSLPDSSVCLASIATPGSCSKVIARCLQLLHTWII
jgi:hypothetical protein